MLKYKKIYGYMIIIFPVDLDTFHIFIDRRFLLEIKLSNYSCTILNISKRNKLYFIIYTILRSWGLMLPIYSGNLLRFKVNNGE